MDIFYHRNRHRNFTIFKVFLLVRPSGFTFLSFLPIFYSSALWKCASCLKQAAVFFTFSPINVSKNCCCTAFLRQPEMQKRRGRPEAPARRDVSFRTDPPRPSARHHPAEPLQPWIGIFKKALIGRAEIVQANALFKIVSVPAAAPPAQREPPFLRQRRSSAARFAAIQSSSETIAGIFPA